VQERLQKILARAGLASRRGAEQIMVEGRVTVNGEIARELGTKADLETDDVRVDGVRVKAPKSHVYLVLNKPRGIVTTRKDPEGRATVMDLVPPVAGLFPVGRLDVTTEGLILLTNDGAFAERVSHPRYEVPRVYHAKVHGVPDEHALGTLRRGVRVDGETMSVDRVRLIEAETNAWVEVTLHEGKHHEVKRMLEAVGHPVSKLRRVAVGPVTTRGLEPGQFRALAPAEIAALLRGEGRPEGALRPIRRRRPARGREQKLPASGRGRRLPASGRGHQVPARDREKGAAGVDRARRSPPDRDGRGRVVGRGAHDRTAEGRGRTAARPGRRAEDQRSQPATRWGSHGSARRGQRERRRG
jgi:23S rRNA pseudouridine2605 synthase